MKTIEVEYFAIFRERKGKSRESVTTSAETAADLYDELGLDLPKRIVRASINLKLHALDTPIADRDRIAFIPPVAGG